MVFIFLLSCCNFRSAIVMLELEFNVGYRSTLVVLGLVQDSQASGPAQTSHGQGQAAETGSSAADVATEVTQESTAIS